MKVLVLGTSNSIMREGWLSLSRNAAEYHGMQYDNQSVGASTSLYLAYRLHDLNLLDNVDRVIIDFCINDQIYIDAGIYDISRAEGHYMAAFRQLAQRGMLSKTIVLLFPQQRFAVSGEACPLIERLQALCHQFGVSTLDAGPLVIAGAAARNQDVAEAYTDPRHFAPEYQDLIGSAVLGCLRRMRPSISPTVWANRRALRLIPTACIRPLYIQPHSEATNMNVGTSLVRRDVISFPHNACATVSGAKWLLGVFHWTHANSGAFCLLGAYKTRRFHLRRAWKDIFLFDDVTPPFPLQPEGVMMHAANTLSIPYTVLQGQRSSIYDCSTSTVDLVALAGSDFSPEELSKRVVQCHVLCSQSVTRRLIRSLRLRLLRLTQGSKRHTS